MELYITSIGAGAVGEIFITFEIRNGDMRDTVKFLISDATYIELSLSKGQTNSDVYDTVEREAQIYAVYKKALYMLGFSSSSRLTLRRKLIAKGYSAEFSDLALERLEANGLLRENESALREGEKCLAKLWGAKRICAHLKEKGYSDDAINEVLFAFEDMEIDFDENCALLIRKKYSRISLNKTDKKEMQKIIASLTNYGYSMSQIKNALKKI